MFNEHISFGEPEMVRPDILGLGTFYDELNGYYQPPVFMPGLDALTRANATHRRCINFKVTQAMSAFEANPLISRRDCQRAIIDVETFGNVYFQKKFNSLGQIVRLTHVPAVNMRKGKNDVFKLLQYGWDVEDITFAPGEILHGYHYDTGQDIYGLPKWIATVQDVFLNSEATLFRRRYYKNGNHLGFILYTSDPKMDEATKKEIEKAVKDGKGVGNFKSMFINIPDGKEKSVQIIPVGDINQKDEFEKIKNISADDIIVGHGIQPMLAGMKPNNMSGFGDILKIDSYFQTREMPAVVQPFLELNEFLPARGQFVFNFESSESD